MIRPAVMEDAEAICNIYNYYVTNTSITFEEEPVTVEDMKARIGRITQSLPYYVYESDNKIIGYAYATKWKERSAYRYSVETTVYLDKDSTGAGIGTKLYLQLINDLKARNIHRAMGGIALPNESSIALHEKLGFKKVAEFNEVGNKLNKWLNVGYWEYKLK